jgi:hypothetical protein
MEPNLAESIYIRSSKYEKVNERMPVSGELKNEEKRAITPRRVIRFTSGHVDLDKLNMFAV